MSSAELRPDTLAMTYHEAKGFLDRSMLQHKMLVLEDQFDGEIIARALLRGGPDEYTVVGKDLESGDEWERTVGRNQAAELVSGWSVVDRIRDGRSSIAGNSERDDDV